MIQAWEWKCQVMLKTDGSAEQIHKIVESVPNNLGEEINQLNFQTLNGMVETQSHIESYDEQKIREYKEPNESNNEKSNDGDTNMKKKNTKLIVGIIFSCVVILSLGIGGTLIFLNNRVDDVSQAIMDDIDSIGDVTLDDAELINKTITRYATLTDKQKNQVKNYSKLLDAEDQLKKLEEDAAENAKNDTKEKFKTTVVDVYACAIQAEEIIDDLRKIWDKGEGLNYVEGVFYNDAQWEATLGIWSIGNYAPLDLMTTTRENVAKLKEANEVVVEDNKNLTSWPDEMSEEKKLYDDLYGYYLSLYDSATSPSGNYLSYCSNTNDYIDGFIAAYKKLEPYLDK